MGQRSLVYPPAALHRRQDVGLPRASPPHPPSAGASSGAPTSAAVAAQLVTHASGATAPKDRRTSPPARTTGTRIDPVTSVGYVRPLGYETVGDPAVSHLARRGPMQL